MLSAAYTRQTDSNLFRLSDDADVNALIGKPSAAEEIGVTSLGFNLNKAYSLQRFELSINLVDTQYQNFSYLDYVARNYNAAWRWSFTPRLHGSLGTQRKETLNSFTDYQNFSQRNQRINNSTRFDAAYDVNGAWQLLAGLTKSSQTNEQQVLAEADYNSRSADVGLRFTYASGSALTYTLKNTEGSYDEPATPSSSFNDESFTQTDQTLQLVWAISSKSLANLSFAHIKRKHPNLAQLDYSGLTPAFNFNWKMTGKTSMNAGLSRELLNYQAGDANYTQTDRYSVGPTWQVSPKTVVRLRHAIAKTKYLGAPASVTTPQRSDTLRDTSLSVDWEPYQRLVLSASLQNSARSSNLAGLDFDSNLATLSAQFTF